MVDEAYEFSIGRVDLSGECSKDPKTEVRCWCCRFCTGMSKCGLEVKKMISKEEKEIWRSNLESTIAKRVIDFMEDNACEDYKCSKCSFGKACKDIVILMAQMPEMEE
jgi:hypothetical protein